MRLASALEVAVTVRVAAVSSAAMVSLPPVPMVVWLLRLPETDQIKVVAKPLLAGSVATNCRALPAATVAAAGLMAISLVSMLMRR